MIGNDVVDLTDPEAQSGATHPRFDGRVFARSELQMLGASGAPNRLRWMLWAAKEAAYKAVKKMDPRAVFSPSKFVVQLDETLRGEVSCEGRTLQVALCEEATSVHAIATSDVLPESRILSGTHEIEGEVLDPDLPSEAAREFAIRELASALHVPSNSLAIAKRGRVPTLLHDGESTGIDLSLSHHGRVVGFACDIGPPENPHS